MPNNYIDSIRLSGTTYQIQGEITVDAALDSGSTNPVENKAIYNKFDEVEQVTAAALNELNEAVSGKQDTLVSSTNIKTINNESILGSGNIDIQGGGKAIEAGRGITITTGETADTVSFNIPIYSGSGTNAIAMNYSGNTASSDYSHAEGYYTTASGRYSHAEGDSTIASGRDSHAEGYFTTASGSYSHAEGSDTKANGYYSHVEGYYTIASGQSEHASGQYNVSNKASNTFGDSGNTLFSVGNGTYDYSTDTEIRHNAFEIRQNGDIYISSGNTDIKLQDHLGGGGGGTVDPSLDPTSTNPVENKAIYNKFDEVEQVTAAGLNALNDKITPTVELTQAQYDALVDKDPNTYYIITDAEAGDLTNYYTKSETNTLLGGKADTATTYTMTEVDTALGGKQATLVSGTNIKTINNESILGSGNIDIQGGSDINVVQTTGTSTADVMSQDAVTTQLNNKANKSAAVGGYKFGSTNNVDYIQYTNVNNVNRGNEIYYPTINGKGILTNNSTWAQNNYNFQLVETSAITTSVTSASTDVQVPSAKAVYNAIQEGGGGGSSYTAGDGIDITNDVISVTGKVDASTYNTYTAATDTALASKADTSAVTAIQDSLSGYVTTDTEQTISGRKIFTYTDNSGKAIEFKQTSDSAKVGFSIKNSASTNNEVASFEFRPNTFTIDGVHHPLIYFGHYRNKNTAYAGVPQTVIGFRQYDQLNAAAYHYLLPLPEKAKTPFNLTTSFKDYYAPMGFKNGSTMITAHNTGVVDLSSELGGLKLKKLTQAEYNALATKDSSTLYIIVN